MTKDWKLKNRNETEKKVKLYPRKTVKIIFYYYFCNEESQYNVEN